MKTKIRNFTEFKEVLQKDSELQELFKTDPVNAIQQYEQSEPVYTRDKWVYRMVVGVLGLVIVVIVIGVTVLMFGEGTDFDKNIPTMLTAICSAAVGAITGLLAPAPRNEN